MEVHETVCGIMYDFVHRSSSKISNVVLEGECPDDSISMRSQGRKGVGHMIRISCTHLE